MSRNRGFTLLELMIVVAVIAILAAIALPSYLSQTRKSRRSEVEGAMQQISLFEERFRADCTTYAASFGATCATLATLTFPSSPYSSSYYTVTLPAVAGGTSSSSFTIKAVASSTGSQSRDTASGTSCATLYYTYGQDTNVDSACSVTTALGTTTKCPAACWSK